MHGAFRVQPLRAAPQQLPGDRECVPTGVVEIAGVLAVEARSV